MIIKEIYGRNRASTYSKIRYASRAIIIRDGKILLSHTLRGDIYMLPGGGLEENETMEQCCLREVEEETGFRCKILSSPVQLEEYYEAHKYIDRYYICEIVGQGEKRLTEGEVKARLVTEWMPVAQCVEMFSHHRDFEDFEEKRGIYLREYTALCQTLADKRIGKG